MERKKLEILAKAAHEINKIWCEYFGDTSQKRWEESPSWHQSSYMNGVEGVLQGGGFEQLHESWLKEKVQTGWKYGPVKDLEKKEHPCLIPYYQLPPEQKVKDELFAKTVKMLDYFIFLLEK